MHAWVDTQLSQGAHSLEILKHYSLQFPCSRTSVKGTQSKFNSNLHAVTELQGEG